MKTGIVQINDIAIEGIEGDWIFESIRSRNTFYEDYLLEQWLPYVKKSRTVLDIGANLGNHTLYFSKNIEYDKIFSFEPYSVNFERLCNNISNNQLLNVMPVNKGVGAHKGYSEIKEFTEENYGATTLNPEVGDSGDIEIIDIDTFVAENGVTDVDFVKIDTEGFEEAVLAGMAETIEMWHPDFWIEVTTETYKKVIQSLLAKGYVLVDVSKFNILFLHQERHPDVQQVDLVKVLGQMLWRTNDAREYRNQCEVANKKVAELEQALADMQ